MVKYFLLSLPEQYISFARIILCFFRQGDCSPPQLPPPRTLMPNSYLCVCFSRPMKVEKVMDIANCCIGPLPCSNCLIN